MLNLPRNIYIMSMVMSLSFTTTSMMVLVAGLLGAAIAPSPKLATLPIAMMVVGTAAATIPAAMIMQRLGRKLGLACGMVIALLGTCCAYYAAMQADFWLFVLGVTCLGFNAAFIQQGRFVIIENAQNAEQQADGLTLALLANLFAAVIGPQLGAVGKDMIDSPAGFAGSFLFAGGVQLCALLVLLSYTNLPIVVEQYVAVKRSLRSLAKQPAFIVAAGSAAVGYGVMSLVMTATPISMHELNGHSLEHTTLVIQSHIVAMFLPSLMTGYLVKRGYRNSLLFAGLAIYLVVCLIAFSGAQVVHYWWALMLLGVGWNLMFLTSTALLPNTYRGEEKFKAQALNDFLIFSIQAISAFAAGWLLFNIGWTSLVAIALIITIAWSIILLFMHQKPLTAMSGE